jgi:hypothetical protein
MRMHTPAAEKQESKRCRTQTLPLCIARSMDNANSILEVYLDVILVQPLILILILIF